MELLHDVAALLFLCCGPEHPLLVVFPRPIDFPNIQLLAALMAVVLQESAEKQSQEGELEDLKLLHGGDL